jgi:hypothetical protein
VDRFICAHLCGGDLPDADVATDPVPSHRGRPRNCAIKRPEAAA